MGLKKITYLGLKILLISVFFSSGLYSQDYFLNPILAGSHPDPSICRLGDTYYMVNSTFEYFPGLPIHKSEDLVNWELIGYGLNRNEQVANKINLSDVQSDGGIHAPTIRYHKGLFYIITTNVYYHEESKTTDFVNFIITAEDPAGEWSNPHVINGAPGIDPDLFFDEDGRAWYVGTQVPEKPNFPGEGEIWLQELDLENWKLKGNRHFLWRGACGGVWAEGPHMYKYKGKYYLMIAEGGTSYNHAVMIALSDKITGPYTPNDRNPILTSRHLSYDNWVHSTGHADMIELSNGRWFMVALGIRGDQNRASNMGRESFLIPMAWEQEPFEWKTERHWWPVIAPKNGKINRNVELPFKGKKQLLNTTFTDEFENNTLNLSWNFRRVPLKNTYSLTDKPGYLRLYTSKNSIANRTQTSLIGFRQKESDFEYIAKLSFNPQSDHSIGGINLFQKDNNYISYYLSKSDKTYFLNLSYKNSKKDEIQLHSLEIKDYTGKIELRVVSSLGRYTYSFKLPGENTFNDFFNTEANLILSKGYTGAFLGLYSTSNNHSVEDFLDIDWVKAKWFMRD